MEKINIEKTNEVLYFHKLDNGLEIYILPNNNQKNFYITFNTRFGSNNIEFKKNNESNYTKVPNGIAHYLEHLMFNMKDGSAFDYFSKLGSSVNAFTTYDLTCYEVYSSTYFKENLNYLLDYVQTPYFTEKIVDNERGIITEEINMYNNNPNTELTYAAYRNIFVNDSRKNLISGNVEDIKKIKVKDIFDCYDTFYNPSNMFIIITGKVNPYEAISIIEENQKNKVFNEVVIQNKKIIEPLRVVKEYEEIQMNVETNKVSISYKIPKKNFKKLNIDDLKLKTYISLLFNILYGVTSNIQENLISSKVINSGININKTFTKDYIVISLTTETEYPESFIRLVRETINNIDIDIEELERKIKVYKSNYILHFDDIETVNNNIQDNIIEYNKFINNYMDLYDKLNINTLNDIIKNIKNRSESILIIKPKTTK
ncbi:MAG: insulinase family protein [Bacilli bacterium]|nr:insulinase family protein [Bacilli bacterium]